jgi:predicted HD phosphohydrolase
MPRTALDDLLDPLRTSGRTTYGGEPVSVADHSLQTAAAAERDGASRPLTVASLFHDIGWLLTGDRPHEMRGSIFLAQFFGPPVTDPVRLHVPAKRYLCTVDVGYESTLSEASRQTFRLQGGRLDEGGLASFDAETHAEDAIRLRRYDDEAKVPGAETPDLAHFIPLISELRYR